MAANATPTTISAPLIALPLCCVDSGLGIALSGAREVIGARVVDAGVKRDVAFVAADCAEGVDVWTAVVLVVLIVIVILGGLIVTVDLMEIVEVLVLSLLAFVLLSPTGMIQNSADTNPPFVCTSPSASVARTSHGTLQSPKHCTVHSKYFE